jgi:hypothetical protein
LIELIQNEPLIQIKNNPFKPPLKEITQLIATIKSENEKIEKFFEKIFKTKDQILDFNNDLIQSLELFCSEVREH